MERLNNLSEEKKGLRPGTLIKVRGGKNIQLAICWEKGLGRRKGRGAN